MLKEFMVKDHARLIGLLDKFLFNLTEGALIRFIGNVRRHMELENEIIYGLSKNKELAQINKKILDDHADYFEKLNEAESSGAESVDLKILKKLRANLVGHDGYEEIYFYPVIEQILKSEEIADLIDKVKDEVNFA